MSKPKFIQRMTTRLAQGFSLATAVGAEYARLDRRVKHNPRLLKSALRDLEKIDQFVTIEGMKFKSLGGNTLWGVGAEPVNLQAACLLFKAQNIDHASHRYSKKNTSS